MSVSQMWRPQTFYSLHFPSFYPLMTSLLFFLEFQWQKRLPVAKTTVFAIPVFDKCRRDTSPLVYLLPLVLVQLDLFSFLLFFFWAIGLNIFCGYLFDVELSVTLTPPQTLVRAVTCNRIKRILKKPLDYIHEQLFLMSDDDFLKPLPTSPAHAKHWRWKGGVVRQVGVTGEVVHPPQGQHRDTRIKSLLEWFEIQRNILIYLYNFLRQTPIHHDIIHVSCGLCSWVRQDCGCLYDRNATQHKTIIIERRSQHASINPTTILGSTPSTVIQLLPRLFHCFSVTQCLCGWMTPS